MPPRKKEQLSPVAFRQILLDHDIHFNGSVLPESWPVEARQHFQAIRNINSISYGVYINNTSIPSIRREWFRKKVRLIKKRVTYLLEEVATNESTWRNLEHQVLERFEQSVICQRGGNEMWKSDHEASCSEPANDAILQAKRRLRTMCVCGTEKPCTFAESSRNEQREIFASVKDMTITHASDDDLDRFSISMKPDLILGLRSPTSLKYNDCWFPVRDNRILMPFFVLEAKRSDSASGFRAIQHQTAFVIRRLLKDQKLLLESHPGCEPPLVWFLGYKGELWQLHVGLIKGKEISIYDLWTGTIQAEDGALQLLLMMDYIWSWARDIYRPTVWKTMSAILPNPRDLSPGPAESLRDSVVPSSISIIDDQENTAMEGVIASSDAGAEHTGTVTERQQFSQDQEPAFPSDASSHPFLKWAIGHPHSPSWTKAGSIRHANIIHFEFRCYTDVSTDLENRNSRYIREVGLYLVLASRAIPMMMEQLNELGSLWTSTFSANIKNSARRVPVSMFVQTFLDQETWQIKRVLNCIIWSEEIWLDVESIYSRDLAYCDYLDLTDIKSAIISARNTQGRDSVFSALTSVSMFLEPKLETQGLEWTPFQNANLPPDGQEILKHPAMPISKNRWPFINLHRCGGLAQIESDPELASQSWLPADLRDKRSGDSMLAVRSPLWNSKCPEFRLFVLSQEPLNSFRAVHRLLGEALRQRNLYGDSILTKFPYGSLREWRAVIAAESWHDDSNDRIS